MRTTFYMFPNLLRGLLEIVSRVVTTKIRTVVSLREVFAIVTKKALLTLAAMGLLVHIIQAPTIKAGKNLKEFKLKPLEHPANFRKNIKIIL